jgi:hypothetical protein
LVIIPRKRGLITIVVLLLLMMKGYDGGLGRRYVVYSQPNIASFKFPCDQASQGALFARVALVGVT